MGWLHQRYPDGKVPKTVGRLNVLKAFVHNDLRVYQPDNRSLTLLQIHQIIVHTKDPSKPDDIVYKR